MWESYSVEKLNFSEWMGEDRQKATASVSCAVCCCRAWLKEARVPEIYVRGLKIWQGFCQMFVVSGLAFFRIGAKKFPCSPFTSEKNGGSPNSAIPGSAIF
jgi:hypothetical protein